MPLRSAKRSSAKPLIGIYAESGTGKTLSALYLARGFVGPEGRIAMIETEQGRGEAYADVIHGSYDVETITGNYSPEHYGKAITECECAGVDALIIDSASHEWEGLGGVLDMADKNKSAGKKAMLVWQKPKMDHQKHFIGRLLQTPIPLVIICMRAKYPMAEQIKNGKKQWVRSDKLSPKQSEDILYEMFVHGWIDHDHRWHSTKVNRDELRQIFVESRPISVQTGEALAKWARDGDVSTRNNGPRRDSETTLDKIIDDIAAATTNEALLAVATQTDKLDNDEKVIAREAYRSRRDELRDGNDSSSPPDHDYGPPAMTDEEAKEAIT